MLNALIIDDEVDICYLLTGILRNRNLKSDYVTSLFDAVIALRKQAPSFVFIDNHLPDGKGSDFISYIRETRPDTKIVMITAHDTAEDKRKALKMGADSFISKPFTSDIIYRTIYELSN